MDVLPELTLRELVNYGRPLVPTVEGLGHGPTVQERIENDDPAWGDEWHQIAERRGCGSGCVVANARLIAAAPDLLDVAEMVLALATIDTSPELIKAATAAIAKARGAV